MAGTRVRFKCATAIRLCAAHAVQRMTHIPSQRACASSVGKTPSFSFCQVDMYENGPIYIHVYGANVVIAPVDPHVI